MYVETYEYAHMCMLYAFSDKHDWILLKMDTQMRKNMTDKAWEYFNKKNMPPVTLLAQVKTDELGLRH